MKKLFLLSFAIYLTSFLTAQEAPKFPDELSEQFQGLKFRNVGPHRGGRSNAVSGVKGDPMTYYMGTVGGGVYKSQDGGMTWKNITDGQLKSSSVGAIAVSESDPNVVYVGMGEHAVRGVMTSFGDGVYKSMDAGKTWTHIGLDKSEHISRIRIHPQNPDVIYVAVQGALYGPTMDRGIYKSTDGGKNWKKILYVDDKTGASDLSMDMNNPRILYASMWDYQRFPHMVRSGGPGSGIHKSTDGGETWNQLKEGLPKEMGKVAVDVSRANSEVVYANIEADKGGVYKSIDAGKKWQLVCSDRTTIARAWYYIEIYADPQNEDIVYVMNAPYLKSIDGGKSFSTIRVPHGDQHDLWINPDNNKNIINANDGGGNVTFNNGGSWTSQEDQVTAQFYRVITDNQFPYRIYGGQQDNSTVGIKSRTNGSGIGSKDWDRVAGGESAFIAFDEDDPKRIYGGSYQGNISFYDTETGITKDIMAYPVIGLGTIAKDMKYRFNWNAPIVSSPQDPNVIYHGGNHVLKSTDSGNSWKEISQDLTRNDKTKQGPGGAPFTNEGAGGENYNTITYMTASQHAAGTLYVGTDDGLLHVTQDDGKNWKNISPPGIGEALINCIEVSPHNPAKVYVVVSRYKLNDKQPMVFVSENYGSTWVRKENGLQAPSYARVIREDKKKEGLLYAGTENGLFISHNGGEKWYPMQLNLPVSPVNDLTIRDNDLVVATSGRAFWVLDDLSSIQEFAADLGKDKVHFFSPKPSYKYGLNSSSRPSATQGQNPLPGIILDYYLPEKMDSSKVSLEILEGNNKVIRSYSSKKDKENPAARLLPVKKGVNRFNWEMNKDELPKVKGLKMLQGLGGHTVSPGNYKARLSTETDTITIAVEILPYSGIKASMQDYQDQYAFLNEIEEVFTDVHTSVNRMNAVKKQLESQKVLLKEEKDTEALVAANDSIVKDVNAWLDELIQPKHKTFQDIINFENQLNAELLDLKGRADGIYPGVTAGSRQRFSDLKVEWAGLKGTMERISGPDLKAYNDMYRASKLPSVIFPKE